MLILPSHRSKILRPFTKEQKLRSHPTTCPWVTWYRVQARAHDGHIIWDGWTQDRDDAEEFLRCVVLGEHVLPSMREWFAPCWPSWLEYEDVVYQFATTTFLTTTSATNWPVPADWVDSNNTCEVLGGGGNGGAGDAGGSFGGGGGASGAYSSVTNLTKPAANFKYLAGGVTADSWFSNTTVAPTSTSEGCLAKGGSSAASGAGGGGGGTGGAAASGIGSVKKSGKNGGAGSSVGNGGGGAGAASSAADGNAGTNGGASFPGSGGSGGNGSGSGGGSGAGPDGNGSAGTNWDGSHGSGGGGGGGSNPGGTGPGGNGGNYGSGAGGGASDSCGGAGGGGTAKQGIVVTTYTANVLFAQSVM